jgi:hypothetical protein
MPSTLRQYFVLFLASLSLAGSIIAKESIAEKTKTHWSFQPVIKPALPSVKNNAWPRNAIDHFILTKLESKNIPPSPRADASALIRRAYFTLTGLPPKYSDVAAFITDSAKDPQAAWAALIDRLLASPQYGERWGRYWLDIARYADSKGYVFQEERSYPFAYTYRDWVVKAINDDLPYDKFITYQLAADKAATGDENKEHLAAMGFLTVGRRFLNRQPDIIDDRIDVVTRGTMGLTVACARCHDHKFDPIPTADYYSLYGVFDSSHEPGDLDKPIIGENVDKAALAKFNEKKAAIQKEQQDYLTGKLEMSRSKDHIVRYLEIAAQHWDSNNEARKSESDSRNVYSNLAEHWHRYLKETEKQQDPVYKLWHSLRQIPQGGEIPYEQRVTQKLAELTDAPPELQAAITEQPPASFEDVQKLYGQLLSTTLREASKTPDSPLTIDVATIDSYLHRKHRDEQRDIRKKLDKLTATSPGAPPRAMVMLDHDSPREPVIFTRGNPDIRGEKVPRQFLEVIAGKDRKPFTNGSGRLELAQSIVASDNPLTPRVMANRVWLNHFDQSLTETPSDFGLQCPPPFQSDLLDYLAATFRDNGWSLKKLHREIMLSATYQQSSDLRSDCDLTDPENTTFHRMQRRRLDFEALRDSLLSVSGNIDFAIGGRAVKITKEPFTNRRTLYGFVDRQNLPPVFRTFDFASPDTHSPKRHMTTVPQQALYMMNGNFVYEQAKALANNEQFKAHPDAAKKIDWLYRQIFARDATPEDRSLAIEFVETDNPQTRTSWSFGYGWFDEATKQTNFTRLPHFSENCWKGGQEMPDPTLGWVSVTATSGHPGNDDKHATIARWVATRSAVIEAHGEISRPSDQGDGVRARIVSSRHGLIGTWDVDPAQKVSTHVPGFSVREGDVIDFIVDCRGDSSFDSYGWAPQLKPVDETAPMAELAKEFSGPIDNSLWQRYAHALLSSNELLFID